MHRPNSLTAKEMRIKKWFGLSFLHVSVGLTFWANQKKSWPWLIGVTNGCCLLILFHFRMHK